MPRITVKLKGFESPFTYDDAAIEDDDWAVYVIQYASANRARRRTVFPKGEISYITVTGRER